MQRSETLATKRELARDPAVGAVMDSEAREGGYFGALELKLRANEASNRGDSLRAIYLLREALRHDPCNAELHFRLGANLWQIADVDAGMAELEIAVQLDPAWDRSQVETAVVLLNQDRNDEAVRRLEAAKPLLREPSAHLLLHLGFARERSATSAQRPRRTRSCSPFETITPKLSIGSPTSASSGATSVGGPSWRRRRRTWGSPTSSPRGTGTSTRARSSVGRR